MAQEDPGPLIALWRADDLRVMQIEDKLEEWKRNGEIPTRRATIKQYLAEKAALKERQRRLEVRIGGPVPDDPSSLTRGDGS